MLTQVFKTKFVVKRDDWSTVRKRMAETLTKHLATIEVYERNGWCVHDHRTPEVFQQTKPNELRIIDYETDFQNIAPNAANYFEGSFKTVITFVPNN
jgi:hypothetical protein